MTLKSIFLSRFNFVKFFVSTLFIVIIILFIFTLFSQSSQLSISLRNPYKVNNITREYNLDMRRLSILENQVLSLDNFTQIPHKTLLSYVNEIKRISDKYSYPNKPLKYFDITYADGCCENILKEHYQRSSNYFNDVFVNDFDDLNDEDKIKVNMMKEEALKWKPNWLENVGHKYRGGGYWSWKHPIILKTLMEHDVSMNTFFFYSDASVLFHNDMNDFLTYLDKYSRYVQDNDFFHCPIRTSAEIHSKYDAFHILGLDYNKYRDALMTHAGLQIYRNTYYSRFFLKLASKYCYDKRVNTDAPSIYGKEGDNFVENKHDQTALSLLLIKLEHYDDSKVVNKFNCWGQYNCHDSAFNCDDNVFTITRNRD